MNSTTRLSSICALGLFALFASAQDLSQKVTLRSSAATVKALFEKLTKQTGVVFVTSALTASEILAVDVADVPLSSLMERIAAAAGAEWDKDSEGYRLVRSQALANRQDREYVAFRAQAIKAEVERMVQELAAFGPFDPQAARKASEQALLTGDVAGASAEQPGVQARRTAFPRAAASAPIQRALTRVLAALSPADLAAIRPASRVVYAITPTSMQRSLPPGAVRAIETFAMEQQQYAKAAAAETPQLDNPRMVIFGDDTRPNPIRGAIAEALLIVTRAPASNSLHVELKIADQTGSFVGQAVRNLSAADSTLRTGEPRASGKGLADRITLSDEALAHARLMIAALNAGGPSINLTTSGGRTVAIRLESEPSAPETTGGQATPPEWRSRLASPDRYEPLGFAASELLFGLAGARQTNLVACVPDSALIPLSRRAVQPITAKELLESLEGQLGMVVEESANWTVVRPRFHALSRQDRVDRAALGTMLRSIVQEGRLSLDALGKYALTRRVAPGFQSLEAVHVARVEPSAATMFTQAMMNWTMVRLYAQLDPLRRSTLADGGVIALGTLTPQQSANVNSLVFDEITGPTRSPRRLPGGRSAEAQEAVFSIVSQSAEGALPIVLVGHPGAGLADERTEYLPFGTTSDGTLTLSWNREPAVLASSSAEPSAGAFLTAPEYGAMMASQSLRAASASVPPSQFDRFRAGYSIKMTFLFTLTPEATMTRELRDAGLEPGTNWLTYEQLPAQFRAVAEDVRRRMAEAQSFIRKEPPGRSGNLNPPPR